MHVHKSGSIKEKMCCLFLFVFEFTRAKKLVFRAKTADVGRMQISLAGGRLPVLTPANGTDCTRHLDQ